MSAAGERYRSFQAFYPFYLGQHAHPASRRLHVVGTGLALACLGAALAGRRLGFLLAPVAGYGLAWVGHGVFERNRPATFTYPAYSLAGDVRLFLEVVTGRRPW